MSRLHASLFETEASGEPTPTTGRVWQCEILCFSVLLEELPLPPEDKKQFSVQRTQVICTSQLQLPCSWSPTTCTRE